MGYKDGSTPFIVQLENPSYITRPSGFALNAPVPINIYRNAKGEIKTDLDASNYQWVGAGKTYYVNPTTGNDTTGNGTSTLPYATIGKARSLNDADVIMLADGFYRYQDAFNGTSVNRNISIKAMAGATPILTTHQLLTWTKTGGFTNVYQASRTLLAAGGVYDSKTPDSNGDFTKLTAVASIALVDITVGSYYYDGTILYVCTTDSRAADSLIFAFLDKMNFSNVGNFRTYLEGITFYGGNVGGVIAQVTALSDTALCVMKNCSLKYATAGNGGLSMLGTDAVIQNCVAARNFADGFNYHWSSGRVNNVIEVGCLGRHNGIGRGTDTDNGSTIHDGGKIVRVNGIYHHNEGPNVHDIATDTQSWLVGCQSYNSGAVATSRQSNYRIESLGKMWLDSCIGYGSFQAFNISAAGELYTRNDIFDSGVQSGTPTSY